MPKVNELKMEKGVFWLTSLEASIHDDASSFWNMWSDSMSWVERVVREAVRSLTAGKKRGQGQGPSKAPAAT